MTRRTPFLGVATLVALLGALVLAGAVAANHAATLTTSLSGAEEVPGPGDPNGRGNATLTLYDAGLVCYTLKLQAIETPLAAHIHEAPAGAAGPVVVDLRLDLADRHGNRYSFCAEASEEIVAEILAAPSNYYVNVHNAPYPGGAVRGQLGD